MIEFVKENKYVLLMLLSCISLIILIFTNSIPVKAYSSFTSLPNPCDMYGNCHDKICLVGATVLDNNKMSATVLKDFYVKNGNINFTSINLKNGCLDIYGKIPLNSYNTWGIISVGIDPTWTTYNYSIDYTNITYSTTTGFPSDRFGIAFSPLYDISSVSVLNDNSETSDKCLISNLGGANISFGNFVSHNCTVTANLTHGNSYCLESYISSGTSTQSYNPSVTYPILRDKVNFTGGCYNENSNPTTGGIVAFETYTSNVTDLELYINNTQSNFTFIFGNSTHIVANITNGLWITLSDNNTVLYNNTTQIIYDSILPIGTHIFTAYHNGTDLNLTQTFYVFVLPIPFYTNQYSYLCSSGVSIENFTYVNGTSVYNSIVCSNGCISNNPIEFFQNRIPQGDICTPYNEFTIQLVIYIGFPLMWLVIIAIFFLLSRLNRFIPIVISGVLLIVVIMYFNTAAYPPYLNSSQIEIVSFLIQVSLLIFIFVPMFLAAKMGD